MSTPKRPWKMNRDRDYVTKAMMESPDYSYGRLLAIADFYTSDGKVEVADLPMFRPFQYLVHRRGTGHRS